ncbi:Carbon-nitrogen hydrolase [Corchorus olitorius]|uniref:Carbon-nitrogen hydrolase n=1 Tax=Corchorus olitorius TaxID=93759 RepID=A0A1R3GZM6_9ROSI|nr:Carbon-nitrogen hydrolase [Corchorus olitorius]
MQALLLHGIFSLNSRRHNSGIPIIHEGKNQEDNDGQHYKFRPRAFRIENVMKVDISALGRLFLDCNFYLTGCRCYRKMAQNFHSLINLIPFFLLSAHGKRWSFDSCPALLDEVQDQYDINAAKFINFRETLSHSYALTHALLSCGYDGSARYYKELDATIFIFLNSASKKIENRNGFDEISGFHSLQFPPADISLGLDKNQNLIHAHNLIKVSAEQGARLVVLPEMWNCPYSADNFAKYAEDFGNGDLSPSFSLLSEVAFCYRITIVGGSIPELCNGRLYNTCCVFGSDGKLKAKHRKKIFHTRNLTFLLLEINLQLWTQLFVATCSPSRDSAGSYTIWGHSTLVSPFVEIITTSEHEETVVVAEIDYSEIQLRRESFALEKQRRSNIYQFIHMHH